MSSTNQPVPEHINGKKRSRPVEDDPAKVRVIRHVSPGGQETITAKISQQFAQKHAELEEKQKTVEATLKQEREILAQQRARLDKEWKILEERQQAAKRALEEGRKIAQEAAGKRAEEEAHRTEEQTRRAAEEAKLNKHLAAALRRVEDVEKESQKSRNEAAEQIQILKDESMKMAQMMQLMMTKMNGSVEDRGTRFPVEVRAVGETSPMDLYAENTVVNTSNRPPLMSITPTQGRATTQEIENDTIYVQPPNSSWRLASPGPSNNRKKGKAPIRGNDTGEDSDQDFRNEDDDDMDTVLATMEWRVSETPEPSGSDNEEVGRRATTVVQDVQNVPPPRQFTSPRGGGRSATDVRVLTSSPTSQRPSPRPTEITRFRTRTNQAWTNGLATYYGEDAIPNCDTTPGAPRNRTKKMAGVFQRTTLKGFDPVGAKKKTGVRRAMNVLLGIKKDEDVIEKEFASEEEVYRYRDEGMGDPTLQPMRPYFLKKGFTTWNDRLCEKFVDHYEDSVGVSFTEAQRLDAELHFMGRINRLGRLWRKARTKEQEERIAEEKNRLERSRKNTRRMTLYDDRREISAGNMMNRDGTVHEGWEKLYNMLEKMGPPGMSSDESEAEGRRTVYIVKRKPWRSEEVHKMLMFIDNDRNATGATGGTRAGNPPRERRRPTDNRQIISTRDPSLGCPKNYYDNIFYAGLNNREVRALDAQPEEVLPKVVHTS